VGYYTSWYGSWGYGGFGWGTYGWAGGSWHDYRDWCFRPRRRVCDRDWRHWNRGPRDVEREHGPRVPRGILTTDTRDLPRHGLDRPEILTELERRARGRHGREDLPDVTDFVARRRDLPPSVVEAVRPRSGDRVRLRDVPVMARVDDDSGDRIRPATTREGGPRTGGSAQPRPTTANEDRQAPPRPVRPTLGVDRSDGAAGEPAVGRRAIPGTNPRVVPPTTRTDDGPRLRTVPGTNPRVVPPTTRPETETGSDENGRPAPGQRWSVDRPTPRPQPAPPAEDRQGWRSGREVRPTVVDDGTGYRAPAPRSEPPVQRVFGARRYDAPAPSYDSRGASPGSVTPGAPRGYDSRPPSRVVLPTPPSGSRISPTAPATPRPTPRIGAPTAPGPRPSVTPRSQPPSSRPSSPPPSTSSSSGSRSSSSSGTSSRGDSPPPSRRSRDDGR
jgi:hypothetical protein